MNINKNLISEKNSLRAFKIELASLAASTIVGGLFVLLGIGIEKLIKHFQKAREEAEALRKQQETMYKSFVDIGGTEGLNQLIAEYQQLHNIKNRTIEQEQRYQKILSDIKNKFPTLIKHIDAQGNVHLKNADALKREVEYIERVAKAQASLKIAEFNDKLGKQVAKWGELTEKIAKTQEKIKELKQWQETGMPITDGFTGTTQFVKIDTLAEQKQKELEILALENERAVVIDKIADLIYDQAMAYAEVKGYAKDLDDAQQQAIRNFIEAQKTGIITMIENMEKQKKSQEEIQAAIQNTSMQIATQSQDIARVFSESFRNMTDGLDGNITKIREVKDAINAVATTLDEDFFKGKSAEEAAQDIQKLIDVSYEMRTNTGQNFDYYVSKLESMRMNHEQAVQVAGELAKANQNLTIYQQAVAQGFEESTDAANSYAEALINAVDATKELLGGEEAAQDIQPFISNLELIKGYQSLYGDLAKKKWEYVQSTQDVARYTGLETQVVEQHAGKLLFLTDIISNVKMEQDDLGNVTVKVTNLTDAQKRKLAEYGLTERDVINAIKERGDWLSALLYLAGLDTESTEANTNAHKENAQAMKEGVSAAQQSANAKQQNANAAKQEADAVENLKNKYNDLKNNMSQTTRAAYFDTIKQSLNELDGKIVVTKDKFGQLKLATADGSTSPFLSTLNKQLEDLGVQIVLVRDDTGKLKLALSDGQGMTTLTTINEQAKDTKVQLDETVQKIDIINQKKVMPNDLSGINFKKLAAGIDDVFGKVQLLADALSKLEGNLKAIGSVENALKALKAKAEEVKNALKNMLSSGKTDIGSLVKKVTDAKSKIESLRNAIDKLNKTKIALKITGIETIQKNINNVKNSINSLPKVVTKVPSSFKSMTSQIISAMRKIDSLLKSHKSTLSKLASDYKKTGSSVSKAFSSMASAVKSRTSVMISAHNSQRNAINRLASAANEARRAIANLNSSARNAISTLNAYIAKARAARVAGSSVPKAPTASASSYVTMTNQEVGQTQVGQGLMSNVTALANTFTASAGESAGVSGGGMGTSGIIRQPTTYISGFDLDGNYLFTAFASRRSSSRSNSRTSSNTKKEEIPELYTFNTYERQAQKYQNTIRQLEARLQGLNKASAEYRETLKTIIANETSYLRVIRTDLDLTEKRNKQIEARLEQLKNTKNHTKAQREEYNQLQQEYEQNLSKIGSLRQEIEQVAIDIREKTAEMFTDLIDEIVAKYDEAINRIKEKIDNTDFKLNVIEITDPDNTEAKIEILAEKARLYQQEQIELARKQMDLQKRYNEAVKKYGSNSEQAKKVKEELDATKEVWEEAVLGMLQSQKQIQDARAEVADDIIQTMKNYYTRQRDMVLKAQEEQKEAALNAIEAELEALKEAHDEKMKMYDEEIEKINSVYDEKLKQLEEQVEEEDYQEELAEKNAKRTELLNKIAILSRDTTPEGKKKLKEAKKELAEIEKDIAKFMQQRQRELLKEALEEQKQGQIKAIEEQKELEQEQFEEKQKRLEEEREVTEKRFEEEKQRINEHYDNLINNEERWAQIRSDLIKGNFQLINTELNNMGIHLEQLSNGMFNTLTQGFAQYSAEIRKLVEEINGYIDQINEKTNNLSPEAQPVTQYQIGEIIRKALAGEPLLNPTYEKMKLYDMIANSGLAEYQLNEIFRKAVEGTPLLQLTPIKTQIYNYIRELLGLRDSDFAVGGDNPTTPTITEYQIRETIRRALAGESLLKPTSEKLSLYDLVKKYKGAITEYQFYEILRRAKDGLPLLKPTQEKMEVYELIRKLLGFDTGGYTGDNVPRQGALAILHRKELVLNEKQTAHILDTAKIMEKIKNFLPNLTQGNFINKLATLLTTGGTNITNNYELTVNIDKLNGDKEDANFVVKEIMKGLKKMGK